MYEFDVIPLFENDSNSISTIQTTKDSDFDTNSINMKNSTWLYVCKSFISFANLCLISYFGHIGKFVICLFYD